MSDPMTVLSEHTRHDIDTWVAKFPTGQQRSASLAALRAAQHQNLSLIHI